MQPSTTAAALFVGLALLLDERGKSFDSPAFSERIASFRDQGKREMIFVPDADDESL